MKLLYKLKYVAIITPVLMFDNVFLMKNLLGQPPGNVKCHGTQEQDCAEPFATWLPEQECLEIAPEEDCQHLVPLHLEDDL